jgi:hypothetical protein
VGELAFVQERRQTEAPVNFVQLTAGGGVSERCVAYLPPGQRPSAGAAK